MSKYNGYRNWSQWNVSLWVNNDETLYRYARECVRFNLTRGAAAESMLDWLESAGITHTPDGAKYSATAIRAAMVGM